MERRRTPGIIDGLRVIGMAVSVIALVAVVVPLTDLAGIVTSFRPERSASPAVSAPPLPAPMRPGNHGAPGPVSPAPLNTSPSSPSGEFVERDDRGEQGDPRIYLEEAAAVARRYPWAAPWRGETRTDLWINAPGSIGSTSPPAARPVTPSVSE